MKEKKRPFFPILFKVLLLGIITSFIASTIAIVVSYNNAINKAKANLDADANTALEYANSFYIGDSQDVTSRLSSFEYISNYVYNRYNALESVKNAEYDSSKPFSEFEEVFREAYPLFYPVGMPGSQEYFVFRENYSAISEVLQNTAFYSSQDAFYAIKDPNNPDRFIFILDSKHNVLRQKNVYYHCPGSHYDIKKGDKIFDLGHDYIKGYKLSKYVTRFIEIKNYNNTGELQVLGYCFVAYETSQVVSEYAPVIRNEIIILAISGLAVVALYAVLSYFMFVRNIKKLNKAATGISHQLKENKPFEVIDPNITSHDEMKSLGDSFVAMENQLASYVDIIKADAKEKEKINAELEIASKIQLEALPLANFDDEKTSIRAFIKPAKEVGGDFYDYFYLNDNELVIIISDVSGKGIPASLFMMKSKELIKSQLLSGSTLEEAIHEANEVLCNNNAESLFVTSFIGIINFEKEEMKYVNAGHEKPYIISKNKVKKLDGVSNFVLGGMSDMTYTQEKVKFHKGDIIFMFTDGLNESINDKEEEFSYSRIEETLTNSLGSSLDENISNMKNALSEFVGEEEQFDDVTMLIVKYNSDSFTMSFDKKELTIIEDAVNGFESQFSFVDPVLKSKVGIVLDELLNNLVSYEKREDLQIDVTFTVKDNEVKIEIVSNGEDYDPFGNNKKKYLDDFSHDIAEGGFGVTIVENLAKSTKYKYKDGHSHITIVL